VVLPGVVGMRGEGEGGEGGGRDEGGKGSYLSLGCRRWR